MQHLVNDRLIATPPYHFCGVRSQTYLVLVEVPFPIPKSATRASLFSSFAIVTAETCNERERKEIDTQLHLKDERR